MFHVYILESLKDKSQYVGFTQNLDLRLNYHNNKKVKSTKSKTPWKIIYTEKFDTRIEARSKEKYLKSATGRKFRKNLFRNSGD
ncbi:endonuclease [Candidatus Peregrinibacteria bacterium RIFOXYB2_FULL_32_7]|nr:MAG: endonuclease [Candidatus Peregrinibacteria bacterium RIFOXYB2_FULL_32_7]